MRRGRVVLAVAALCMLLLGVRTAVAAEKTLKPDYKIRESFFVTMMTDIFTNTKTYVGKRLQYEGFVLPIPKGKGQDYGPEPFAVVRIAVCCGPDDMPVGFACECKTIPKSGAWVQVTGVLKMRNYKGMSYPYLKVEDLVLRKTKGKTHVSL